MWAYQTCGASEIIAIAEASLNAEMEGLSVTGVSHLWTLLRGNAGLQRRWSSHCDRFLTNAGLFESMPGKIFLQTGFDSGVDAFFSGVMLFGFGIFFPTISRATWVNILQAAEKGESIPMGQAVVADGNPIIDRSKALKSSLLVASCQRGANIIFM